MLDVDEETLLLAFAVFVVLLFLIRLRNYNAFSLIRGFRQRNFIIISFAS